MLIGIHVYKKICSVMQQSGLNFTFQLVRIRNSADVHWAMKYGARIYNTGVV